MTTKKKVAKKAATVSKSASTTKKQAKPAAKKAAPKKPVKKADLPPIERTAPEPEKAAMLPVFCVFSATLQEDKTTVKVWEIVAFTYNQSEAETEAAKHEITVTAAFELPEKVNV